MSNEFLSASLQEFPTEVLIHIFSYSSPKQLYFCRRVCVRWKDIIDSLLENETLWRQHCRIDFGELSKNAYYKSQSVSNWQNIYRSLTIWPKLLISRESITEFATTTSEQDEIYDFQILRNGLIAVHKQNSIVYYDIKTLQPSKIPKLTGSYLKYMENDDTIVLQSLNFHLFIVRKYVTRKDFEHNITFDDVKIFLLSDRNVYYVTLNDELCVVDLNDYNFSSKILSIIPNGVMTISLCKNCIYILTKKCNIYTLDRGKLHIVVNLKNEYNPLNLLRKYDFLHQLDQQVYFQWMKMKIYDSIPEEFSKDIAIVKTYGDIVFVGTKFGIFRIYYIKANKELNFVNKEPMKEYNFMEKNDLSVRIQQIDVIEGDNTHTVLVALENRIVVLNFTYDFI